MLIMKNRKLNDLFIDAIICVATTSFCIKK